jgi:hypothetical protein
MFLCSSCGLFSPQHYVCDAVNVDSIQLVQLGQFIEEENEFKCIVLSEITDIETFVNRLDGVGHSVNWGDPTMLHEEDTVIKINYKTGDFDLLHWYAQLFNRAGTYKTGYFFFDEDEFNSLVSDYLQE